VRELFYLDLQTRDDSIESHGYRRYWKGHYLPDLSDGAIGALADRDLADTTLPGIGLQAYGGAIADVDDDATAFSHRRTRFEYVAAVKWSDPGEDSLRMEAARREAAKLDPMAVGATSTRSATREPRVCAAPTPMPSARAWPRSRTPTTRTTSFTSTTTSPPPGSEPATTDHVVSGPMSLAPGPV